MAGKKKSGNVSLPSISKSARHSSGSSQGKTGGGTGIGQVICVIIGVLLVLFILLGGINQKAFFETMVNFAKNIGNTFTSWIDKGDIDVTDSGIYIKPAGPNGGIITGHSNESTDESTDESIDNSNDESTTNESSIEQSINETSELPVF